MERLGILFDVSHLGASGVAHVLELATRPVLATHSSARALLDHHRNLTDDQIRGDRGHRRHGVRELPRPSSWPPTRTSARWTGWPTTSRTSRRWPGPDRVGLGPDFIKEVSADVSPPCCEDLEYAELVVPGLEGPRGLPLVTDALIDRGFSEAAVHQILGGNVLDLFRKELGRPA